MIGKTLSHYCVVEKIGTGGMSGNLMGDSDGATQNFAPHRSGFCAVSKEIL